MSYIYIRKLKIYYMLDEKNAFNSCTVNYHSYDCFDKLTNDELKMLEENKVQVSYKKGENICKQGSFASHIMYICKGLVKIYMENEYDSLVLKILPENKMIGLSSLYESNTVFQYSAQAYRDSVVNLIDINILTAALI